MITLDFGAITSIRASINKATSTIPLVSMGVDRAFQLESGSTLTYNIEFKRKSPIDYDNTSSDSTMWSNRVWYGEVTKLINRWQMRTDGCTLTFEPSVTNPFVPAINANGYIKVLSRKFTNTYNELITGSIQFIVGTTHVLSGSMQLQPTLPPSKQYRTIILTARTTVSANDVKKYGMNDVVYTMKKNTPLIYPDMPSQWSLYELNEGKHLSKWTIAAGVEGKPGDNIGAAEMSSYGDIITLKASWGAME